MIDFLLPYWNDFVWIRPACLWLLIPAFLLYVVVIKTTKSSPWSALIEPQLLAYMTKTGNNQSFKKRPLSLLFFMVVVIVAAAGPSIQKSAAKLYETQKQTMVVINLSSTMLASDVEPSRLKRAIYKTEDLLNNKPEHYFGLIVYSSIPFVVSPLTDDSQTLKHYLDFLSPALLPTEGQRLDLAIEKAMQMMTDEKAQRNILILTDSLNDDEAVRIKRMSQKLNGIQVGIIGIGTPEGGMIPHANGDFYKDRNNQVIVVSSQLPQLQQLAQSAQFNYSELKINNQDLDTVISDQQHDNATLVDSQSVDLRQDNGIWIAFMALPFMLLLFRRCLSIILIASTLYTQIPTSVYAFEVASLFERQDQKEYQQLKDQQYDEVIANENSSDLSRANAYYQKGEYQKAAENYEKEIVIKASDGDLNASTEKNELAYYNYANTMTQLDRLEQALELYNKVLEKNPNHQDAAFNKDLVEKELERRKESNDQQQQGDQDQQDSEDQQGDDESDSDDSSQSQQDQNSESEPSESQQNNDEPGESDQSDSNNSSDPSDSEQQTEDAQADEPQDPSEDESTEGQGQSTDEENTEDSDQQQSESQNGEASDEELSEQAQAIKEAEQQAQEEAQQRSFDAWLKQIPDQPDEFLRRKFSRDYQREFREGQQ